MGNSAPGARREVNPASAPQPYKRFNPSKSRQNRTERSILATFNVIAEILSIDSCVARAA